MSSIQKSQLIKLSERDSELQPGRLDTEVIFEDGVVDTMLTAASQKRMLGALSISPEADWVLLLESTTDEHEQELIRRRLAEIELIRIALGQVTGEDDKSMDLKEQETELYNHYSERLYSIAIQRKIKQLESLAMPNAVIGANEMRASIIDELNNLVPQDDLGSPKDVEPTQQTISAMNEWIYSQFEDVFDFIDDLDMEELDALHIKEVFDLCIATTPSLRNTGWSCELLDREKNSVSVYASEKKIIVPTKRKATKEVIKNLVVHEIFGHALRSALAYEEGSVVGAIGTATYQSFEESFEITLEQCVGGTYNPMRGVDHYLSIGMAFTSNKSKEDIMVMFYNISQLIAIANTNKEIDDANIVKSKKSALTQIRRTFAGQTDVDQGIPHLKDIDYLHGTTSSWSLLNEIVKLNIVNSAMNWLLCAKFNPFNDVDRMMVEQFHPMPVELRSFFERKQQ